MAPAPTVLSHFYIISTILIKELLVSYRNLFKFLTFHSDPTSLFQLIEDKAPSTLYKISTSISSSSAPECCSVCLTMFEEGDEIRKLKCKHIFHKECLDRWLELEFAITCPLCRREVLPEDVAEKLRLSLLENQSQCDWDDEELMSLLTALQGTNLHTYL